MNALLILLAIASVQVLGGRGPQAKRVNKAIELLEQGQPVYYTRAATATRKARSSPAPGRTTSTTSSSTALST
jgi:hypothetical protein